VLSGRFGVLHPEGRMFKSHSSHVGTVGNSFTELPVVLRHVNSDTVSMVLFGAPLSSSGLEEAL